jgi:hypothetical protein
MYCILAYPGYLREKPFKEIRLGDLNFEWWIDHDRS